MRVVWTKSLAVTSRRQKRAVAREKEAWHSERRNPFVVVVVVGTLEALRGRLRSESRERGGQEYRGHREIEHRHHHTVRQYRKLLPKAVVHVVARRPHVHGSEKEETPFVSG